MTRARLALLLPLVAAACIGTVGQATGAETLGLEGDGNVGTQSDPNGVIDLPPAPQDPNDQPPPPVVAGPAPATIGRAVTVDANTPFRLHLAQPNIGVGIHFTGTSLRAKMSNTQAGKRAFFNLRVDGAPAAKFAVSGTGAGVYTLADGLAAGEHNVWMVRRNEPQLTGAVDLYDVDAGVDGNLLTPPPTPTPTRRIEMFGASTETGWCTDTNLPGGYTDDSQDATLAWPQLAADAVGASLVNTSVAGAGMRWDHSGLAGGSQALVMPLIWRRVDLSTSNGGLWDPNDLVPTVVFIDLIGNDDYGVGGVGLADPSRQAQWQTTAIAFANALFGAYPGTTIYFIVSAVYGSPQRDYMQSLLADTVRKLQLGSDNKVGLIEMSFDPDASSICGGHPSAAAHQRMAAQAAAQLRRDLGW